MEIKDRLKTLRAATGYSKERMARLCGVSLPHYYKYESGERATKLLEVHVSVLEFLLRKRMLAKFVKFLDSAKEK